MKPKEIEKLVQSLYFVIKQLIKYQKSLKMGGIVLGEFLDKYLADSRKLVSAITKREELRKIYKK